MKTRYIAYYRVSTNRQGASGLGIEAQQEAVKRHIQEQCGDLVGEFTEVESGARSDRPQLSKALGACRKEKGTLVIAKLDRLARNVHFISGLMDSGVDFIAVDNPHANRLMLHLLAAFAEHEREQISQRTRAALHAAKSRGVTLGSFGRVLAERNRHAADAHALAVLPLLRSVENDGPIPLRILAARLNQHGSVSPGGVSWRAMSVMRLKRRISQLTGKATGCGPQRTN